MEKGNILKKYDSQRLLFPLRRDVQMVRRGPERLAQGAIGTQVCSVLLNSPKLHDDPGSQASWFDGHRLMNQVKQTSVSSNQACSVLVQAQSYAMTARNASS